MSQNASSVSRRKLLSLEVLPGTTSSEEDEEGGSKDDEEDNISPNEAPNETTQQDNKQQPSTSSDVHAHVQRSSPDCMIIGETYEDSQNVQKADKPEPVTPNQKWEGEKPYTVMTRTERREWLRDQYTSVRMKTQKITDELCALDPTYKPLTFPQRKILKLETIPESDSESMFIFHFMSFQFKNTKRKKKITI